MQLQKVFVRMSLTHSKIWVWGFPFQDKLGKLGTEENNKEFLILGYYVLSGTGQSRNQISAV